MDSSRSRTQRNEEPPHELAAAPCPVGLADEACDLVTVPTRQGLEAVDILRRGAPAVGPVLHDDSHDTLGFVVPAGTVDAWDLPGSACTQTAGRGLPLAPPAAPAEGGAGAGGAGAGWLLPPTDADPVTDPAALRAALGEAARMIAAADAITHSPGPTPRPAVADCPDGTFSQDGTFSPAGV